MTEAEAAASPATPTDRNRPRLHIHPDHGWLNDPNGLCRIDGTYHVFFQYNPAGPFQGDIHWGHVSSRDLLSWTTEPIALRPRTDGPDRGGCWSGCIVDDAGVPTAVYTGILDSPLNAGVTLSRSDRTLREWHSDNEWRIGVPEDPAITQVRDPFVFAHSGGRYAVQGAGGFDQSPQVLLYGCDDLAEWTYLGPLLTTADPIAAHIGEGNFWECPNLFRLQDSWVLLLSLWRNDVLSGVRYLVGDLAAIGDGLRFIARSGGRLETGPTFYAPQVLVEPDRVLLWGWAWEDADRTADEIRAAGWCGTLTSPREVVMRGDHIRFQPAAELSGLRRELIEYAPGSPLRCDSFETIAPAGLRLSLVDTATAQKVTVAESDGPTQLLVDGSLIEIFGAGPSCTTRAYPGANRHWMIESSGSLKLWRLGLPN